MPQDAMNMWIEELQEDHFRVCLREVKTFDGKYQNIQVDWLAFTQGTGEMTFHGKLQFENGGAPLERDNFAFCKVLNYTETFYAPSVVMVSEITTLTTFCCCCCCCCYCLFSGFLSQKGRHRLSHNPVWAEAVCEQVPLEPYVFYPDKPVHIQVSVNHVNFSDPAYVHEAVVAWVEDIMGNNFTVCVTQAGRNERRNGETFATVDWLAQEENVYIQHRHNGDKAWIGLNDIATEGVFPWVDRWLSF
ncbi:unnamed protein product [Porites lobata]|uniref:Uncharacterized protein n=1 Tax=Porites lobata TaxID=104759 RepID=A0ABN8N9J8_9CNID|nr:unnamed protein product [Porites lobata]